MVLWPDTVITFKNPNSIQVDKKIYYPGDRITYTIDYCKYKNISGIVSRAITDDFRVTFTDVQSNLPLGCHTTQVNDLTIPLFLSTGTYHLTISGMYKINTLRSFETPLLTTESFQVVVPNIDGAAKTN